MNRLLPLLALATAIVLVPVSGRAEQRVANISQGTDMALAMTPDGESLVVDLLGRLWLLPSSGGGARQLTPDDEAARHPRVSPDGRYVAYQRRVSGRWSLWLLELYSGERRALTTGPYDDREPDFTADGSSVVFVSNRTGHFCLWSVEVATGVLTQLTEEPGDAAFPSASERGEIAYVRRNGGLWSLRVLTAQGAAVDVLQSEHRLSAPTWRPGGGVLIYNELNTAAGRAPSSELRMLVLSADAVVKTLTRAEDVFAARVAWSSPGEYYYTADGQIWRRGIAQVSRQPVHLFAAVTVDASVPAPLDAPLDAPGPNPVVGITGRSAAGGGKTEVFTALGDLWLVDGRSEPKRLTDDEFVDFDANVAPQGEFAVFASDRSGYMDLWRVTLPGGVLTQLTNRPEKAYRPSVSPDGRRVAFLETDELGTWGKAELRVMDLGTVGAPRTISAALLAPERPTWNGDGSVSVAARAFPASESSDATWTFDLARGTSSRAALGATAGEDPTAAASQSGSMPPESDPLPRSPIEWRPVQPEAPYVVQVGRLFDGIRSDYLRHVDLHVEGRRITAIVSRGLRPLPAKVIDARDATIIPGLIDVHAHHSPVMGRRLGRAWLAHGVTTVRELTEDLPEAMERAESWASGRRLGPRLIVSPIDSRAGTATAVSPLVTPVPVRTYSALRVASSLFDPNGSPARPAAWAPIAHANDDLRFLLRTSPLNLSYEDVFNTVVQSGTVITSDLAATAGARYGSRAWQLLLSHRTPESIYSTTERAAWLNAMTPRTGLQSLQNNLARLVRAGGRIAAGTEAPAIPYGLGLHLEMALLAEAGIPPDQVLRIATASNALALGLERQIGTLEEGKIADFVVVAGNPLLNLTEAMNISAVVKDGVWIDQQQLVGQ